MFEYETCCVNADGDDITEMCDQSISITYRTFISKLSPAARKEIKGMLGYERQGLTLKGDWHVSYHRSKYQGKRCYYLVHSAIEYVFLAN
jgi:hypothetical protein